MQAMGWKGPENNVSRGQDAVNEPGFQARCRSSSPLPGTPGAGVTLNPGPQGLHGSARNLGAFPPQLFGSWVPPPATTRWCKSGRKNQIWLQVLNSPCTSRAALHTWPHQPQAQLSQQQNGDNGG